jgi:hypothetical protein
LRHPTRRCTVGLLNSDCNSTRSQSLKAAAMPDQEDLSWAREFLEEAEQWLEEPPPHDKERIAAQIECARAANARLRRLLGYRLVCVECGKQSEGGARGWRALLTVDGEVAMYCAQCAAAGFGDVP